MVKEIKIEENKAFHTNIDSVKPFLDAILKLSIEQDTFTDNETKAHVDTIVVAGYDTTATTLFHSLILLGTYADVQEKVSAELKEVLGDSDVTKNDVGRLVYLEAVIKEVLRFCPTLPIIGRHVDSDLQLKNYVLRKGSTCVLSIYGVLRHPAWGADAKEFRPERWLEPGGVPNNPNVFTSFSFGKRNCIGKLYAMVAMKVYLAHVLRKYRVTAGFSKLINKYEVFVKPVSGHEISIEQRQNKETVK